MLTIFNNNNGYFNLIYLRKKWAAVGKDIVALHQLPRSPVTPSPSPFPLKLETYLRMASIPYQVNYDLHFIP